MKNTRRSTPKKSDDDPRPAGEDRQSDLFVHAPTSFAEFVGRVAGLVALNSLAVDIMLMAPQNVGAALDVANENNRQGAPSTYRLGFGAC